VDIPPNKAILLLLGVGSEPFSLRVVVLHRASKQVLCLLDGLHLDGHRELLYNRSTRVENTTVEFYEMKD
jgi:hypothetical protein